MSRWNPTRRQFVKGAAAAAALTGLAPYISRAAGSTNKINLACCGIGNRGKTVVEMLHDTGLVNLVAFCDADMGGPHTVPLLQAFPDVPRFHDFREMFDKMGNVFDAVAISTPDFSHFPIAMLSMSQGKHIYCEKPMGQTFRQIQLMMDAEKKYGVAAQMGNQGHSAANYFQFKAWTDAGIIRNVTRITAFMNSRRRWHGKKVEGLLPAQPVPATLDWDVWLATAPQHDYNRGYVDGDWRAWFDLGNGALGDWGAHIFDTAHEFLQMGLPTQVEPIAVEGWNPFIFPQASTLAFRFPERGQLPPVELTWYEGQGNLPPLPENFGSSVADPELYSTASDPEFAKLLLPGKVIYGEGHTFKGGSHGATLEIIGGNEGEQLPEVPQSPSDHFTNFLRACRGEETCRSSFAVAGPLCQTMALGVIAQRLNIPLTFDPATKSVTNNREANALLSGPEPRREWAQFYAL